MGLIVVLVFGAIVASLALALGFMRRPNSSSSRTVQALTVRIALSVALFVLLLVAWAAGWIQPHGITG